MPVQPGQPPDTSLWWDVCRPGSANRPAACGGVNLGGHGDPASGNGYRQDYSVPLDVGTDVVSPVNGIILPKADTTLKSLFGRQDWGGEVDILTLYPTYDKNNPTVVTLLHFDTLDKDVTPGLVVAAGDHLGTSGGQTSGGNWPSNPKDSSGPHVGAAIRPYGTWGGYWDPTRMMQDAWSGAVFQTGTSSVPDITYSSSTDIRMLQYLLHRRGGQPAGSNLQQTYSNFLGFQFPSGWFAQGNAGATILRGVKILVGALLIAIGIVATIFGPAAPELAAAGATAAGYPEAAEVVRTTLGGRGRQRIARAALAGGSKVQGTRIIRKREAKAQAEAQAEAEERVAEKTAEKTAEKVQARGLKPEDFPQQQPARTPAELPRLSDDEYARLHRRYPGRFPVTREPEHEREYSALAATLGIPRKQSRTPQGKVPLGRTAAKLRGPSAANYAAAQRKRAREQQQAIDETTRQRGREALRRAQEER